MSINTIDANYNMRVSLMANPVRFQSKKFITKDMKRSLNERNVKATVRSIVIHLEA